jgi:hypothetical protein
VQIPLDPDARPVAVRWQNGTGLKTGHYREEKPVDGRAVYGLRKSPESRKRECRKGGT